MKLNYFGYSVRKFDDNSHFLMDFRPFLKAFTDYTSIGFKNKFTHAGENLYLLPIVNNFYLFVITRSDEIIKRVKSDTAGVTVNEIYNLLQNNENIGFASYLYVEKNYFAFASKILSPRFTVFSNFLNDILRELGVVNYCFDLHPFLQQTTKERVLAMPFLGRSTIQIEKENAWTQNIQNFFNATAQDFAEIDSFEITIKPKKGKDIKEAVTKALNAIPDNGLRSIVIKAREDMDANLKEFYILSEGAISDLLDTKDERIILDRIRSKIRDNTILAGKVNQHENDTSFTTADVQDIAFYSTINNWPTAN